MNLPERKKIRMENFDYSSSHSYFLTICSKDRKPIFWKEQYLKNVGADNIRPYNSGHSGSNEKMGIKRGS